MRNSLGALLAIGLAGLQFVAVLAVVFSSYLTSEQALLTHARSLLNDVGTNTIAHSMGFLQPARAAAELSARLAENDVVATDDFERLEALLYQQLQLTPQFAGLFYGREDGAFVYVMRSDGPGPFRSKIIRVTGGERTVELTWRDDDYRTVAQRLDPEDTYDPRVRPWYTGAHKQRGTVWTEPYIFFSSQQPGITLASPVLTKDGNVRGIVGVDIEISEISDFLSRLNIGRTGQALIIHENGDVIAHPNKALLKSANDDGSLSFVNIRDFGDPIARAAFARMTRGGGMSANRERVSQFEYGGETYVSAVMPAMSERLPWTIAAYAPENDFTSEIKQNRLINIWIAALVAVITGITGLALANYIYKPVRAFAVRSALISQGEIDPAEPLPKTYQELEEANTALMAQIAARRETELEYGQTFALSSRGMAQIEPESGRFLRVNARFCEITGYAPDELERMTFPDLCSQDGPSVLPLDDGTVNDVGEIDREMRCRRKDGASIWTAVNAIMIHNQEGRALHLVLTMDDITLNKLKEEKISQLNRDLTDLSRDNTMGQMAAGLAHELNQPLTAIAQNADTALLMIEESRTADRELREVLDEIESQSLRAGEIIRALRSFIRKDEGVRSDFDFAELLDQTKRLVIAEAHEVGAEIRTEVGTLPRASANRVQVAQVLVNLLRNAIEAVAENESSDRRVTVRAGTRDGMIHVCVSDNGPGVDPKVTLFSQFETTKPGGMGLGLSICHSIVQQNGGRLWHEPAAGGGARFCFTLEPYPE